jgi:hypothetical protein
MPYGYDQSNWESAKQEAKALIKKRARTRGFIPYSELVAGITSINFGPHEARFFHLLGEISVEEDAEGRGMISALVVHKEGDMQPGPGFFELAKQLGRDVSDVERCWVAEFKRVHAALGVS